MEALSSLIEKHRRPFNLKIAPGAPRNQREEHITNFLARINPGRVADGFKPYTPERLSKLLEGIPTGDLYAFYCKCEAANNFSKKFHYELKPRPEA